MDLQRGIVMPLKAERRAQHPGSVASRRRLAQVPAEERLRERKADEHQRQRDRRVEHTGNAHPLGTELARVDGDEQDRDGLIGHPTEAVHDRVTGEAHTEATAGPSRRSGRHARGIAEPRSVEPAPNSTSRRSRSGLSATPSPGVPVAFSLLPGALHDLTPVHELTFGLPDRAAAYGDKAFNSKQDEATILAETGVRLVTIRRANMHPNLWADKLALREHRQRIETTNSQMEAMGLQRLRARTNAGFELKVHASLLALALTNAR